MLAAELKVLSALLRGQPRSGSHAERLQAFYAPQAGHYDRFRERLLWGRQRLIAALPCEPGARVVELGAGTGRNTEFFGERLAGLQSCTLVDLCPALLQQAHLRAARQQNMGVIEADAAEYQPPEPVDVVYLSYALSMMPDWARVLDNALSMLRPGGVLGVVDFYVDPVRHGRLASWAWRRWFAHDGVHLGADTLRHLPTRLTTLRLVEHRAAVPYLPAVRVPVYLFVGRKA